MMHGIIQFLLFSKLVFPIHYESSTAPQLIGLWMPLVYKSTRPLTSAAVLYLPLNAIRVCQSQYH